MGATCLTGVASGLTFTIGPLSPLSTCAITCFVAGL